MKKLLITLICLSIMVVAACNNNEATSKESILSMDSKANFSEFYDLELLEQELKDTKIIVAALKENNYNDNLIKAYENKEKALNLLIEFELERDNLVYQSHVMYAVSYERLLKENS